MRIYIHKAIILKANSNEFKLIQLVLKKPKLFYKIHLYLNWDDPLQLNLD